MSERYPPTARTTPTRAAARVGYDRQAVHAVLDAAVVCHVGFVVDGAPVVLPHLYARCGDRLYLHGSTGARMMRSGEPDLQVCVSVTVLDGLVLARSAFHHSVNYRSVVAHGRATLVRGAEERAEALAALVEAVVPGRSADTRAPNARELAATAVLRLDLREVSVKVRQGGPVDDPDDLGLPHWAGVLPVGLAARVPEPDEATGVRPAPGYLTGWAPEPGRG